MCQNREMDVFQGQISNRMGSQEGVRKLVTNSRFPIFYSAANQFWGIFSYPLSLRPSGSPQPSYDKSGTSLQKSVYVLVRSDRKLSLDKQGWVRQEVKVNRPD